MPKNEILNLHLFANKTFDPLEIKPNHCFWKMNNQQAKLYQRHFYFYHFINEAKPLVIFHLRLFNFDVKLLVIWNL